MNASPATAVATTEITGSKSTNIKDIAVKRGNLLYFRPEQITIVDGWNCRVYDTPENVAADAELKESIRENGVLEPLAVYMKDGKVCLSNGHRRLRQVMALIAEGVEIESVKAIVEERGTNEADHVLSQITRNSGKPLTPYEQGLVFKRLIGFGWDETQIAKKTGFSRTHVANMLNLQEAPVEVQEMVKDGTVSASLASKVVRDAPNVEAAKETLREALGVATDGGKTRVTEKHVAAVSGDPERVSAKRATLKGALKLIFDRAEIDQESGEATIVTFSPADFESIRHLLDL